MKPLQTPVLLALALPALALIPATAGARDDSTILWDETHGVYGSYDLDGSFADFETLALDLGFSLTEVTSGVTEEGLSDAGILIVHLTGASDEAYTAEEGALIEAHVDSGGGLFVWCDNDGVWNENLDEVTVPFGVYCGLLDIENSVTDFADHPINDGVSELDLSAAATFDTDGTLTEIAWDSSGYAFALAGEYGDGRVVIVGDVNAFSTGNLTSSANDNELWTEQALDWLSWGMGADREDDSDGDGTPDSEDCAPDDPDIFPGATEVCDDVDNDCDDLVDDEDDDLDTTTADTWYADGDDDGYGDVGSTATACDAPDGYVDDATDCDDGDRAIHPGATEVCDEVDNDCDELVDDEDRDVDLSTGTTSWRDGDEDGFGDPERSTRSCEVADGWVTDATDCDDGAFAVNPDATEVCDEIDNDCDDLVDDADDSVDLTDGTWSWTDSDEDGFGDAEKGTLSCAVPDGNVEDDTDCDDAVAAINPDASEICDELDNDCDDLIDDEDDSVDLSTGSTWYGDGDGDGYGAPDAPVQACAQPDDAVEDDTDCDDDDPDAYPGAPEIEDDGIDQDCDGEDATAPTGGDTGGSDTGSDTGSGDTGGAVDGGDEDPDKEGCGGCATASGSPASGALLLSLLTFGLAGRRRR